MVIFALSINTNNNLKLNAMKASLIGEISLEILVNYMEENNLSVCETISEIHKNSEKYPEKPRKPYLKNSGYLVEVKEYSEKLEQYEKDIIDYDKIMIEYRNSENERNSIIENFIKTKSEFYERVPEKYQKKVYRLAYSNGHSGGYSEVYNTLIDIIDIFE